MRHLIGGIVGLLWGGGILLMAFLRGGPQGEGAYRAGSICGIVTGGLFFVAGAFSLFLGIRELQSEWPRKKKRRRREDDDYYDEGRPRPRRRRRRRDDDD